MLTDLPLVLRLPRVDQAQEEPDFILVHVSSEGRRPFDLKLIGTENSAVFSVSLKHNQTSALKAKNSKISQDQWEHVLSTVLLGGSEDEDATVVEGVEAVAKVEGASSITIIIQKRIEGITQRLGQLFLPANEDEEVDIYEWCGLTIKAKETSGGELERLKAELKAKDEQIQKLDQSFSELIREKNANETQLLEKFSILLNEKKLKIRDQQRLLAGSKLDPAKLQEMDENQIPIRDGPPGRSRVGKRKLGDKTQESDEESDGGFEVMDVDQKAEDSDANEVHTADEETASEDDEPVAPQPQRIREPSVKRSPTPEKDAPPPKRSLPFAKKPPPKPVPIEGSETESDDEL